MLNGVYMPIKNYTLSIKNNRIFALKYRYMQTSKDPLHGKKLVDIIEELVEYYGGFEGLGDQINIRCFTHDPSINSSLKFLRKTPWAREKTESLYLYVLRQKAKQSRSQE